MEQQINEFEQFISGCTDNDLPFISFFDAGILYPTIDEFNILADMIIDELVKRSLETTMVLQARDFIMEILKTNKAPAEQLRLIRGNLAASRIGWASGSFDIVERISQVYDAAFTEDLPIEFQAEEETEENLAPDIRLPKKYSWSHKGELLFVEPNGDTSVVYPEPIYIKDLMINKDNGEEQLRIAFFSDGQEKTYILPPKDVYTGTGLMALSSYGAVIDKSISHRLSRFFLSFMSELRPEIPKKYTTTKVGWLNDSYDEFIPYSTEVTYDSSGKYEKEFSQLLKSRGTLEGWKALIGKYRDAEHIPFRIILASSFASVLIQKLNPQPFFVHLWGPSGTGKSVALRVAGSVWAYPEISGADNYVKRLSGSLEALDTLAQFYGNLPLCLDDRENIASSGEELASIVYNLSAGSPKIRAQGPGGLREQNGWCNAILTNGEHRMLLENTGGGADHRVVEIHVEESVIAEKTSDYAEFTEELRHQYNTAGREFIKKLIQEDGWRQAQELYNGFQAEIQDYAAGRQTGAASAILTADTLISKWIFEDKIRLTAADIIPYLKTKADIDQAEHLHQRLYEWIIAHPGYFDRKNNGTRYGQRIYRRALQKTVIAFIPHMLETLIPTLNGEMSSYINWLKRHNRLVVDKGNKNKFVVEMENYRDASETLQAKKLIKCYGIIFDEENQTEVKSIIPEVTHDPEQPVE